MMQPAGVPGMAPSGSAAGSADVWPEADGAPPRGYAVETGGAAGDATAIAAGPVVAGAVTPIPVGRALGIPSSGDGVPVPLIQVDDPRPAAGVPVRALASGGNTAAVRVAGRPYTIVSGDTLSKIAAKMYKSSKPENLQRIVAANPTMLKNTNSLLFVGKTLIIPDVPVAEMPKAAPATPGPAAPRVVVYAPGVRTGAVRQPRDATGRLSAPKPADKKDAVAVYVVKHGDTLGAIAARH